MEHYKDINLESYNSNAHVFSEYFKGLFDLESRPEFLTFLKLLSGKKILDLGCGGGDHALWFKNQGLDVFGIDFSEKMIEICKSKGIASRVMDIEQLDLPNDSFDGIWSVTSLLHIPRKQMPAVVVKLSDLLHDDGILFVVVKKGEGERFVIDKQNPSTKRFFVFWERNELVDLFSERFEFLDCWEKTVGKTTYIHLFFKNKKSA